MGLRIATRGVIVHDNKLLCFQLKPYRHRPTTDFWCTPGGGVDAGESLLAAVEREILEETGIQPVVGKLLFVQQFRVGEDEQMELFFHIKNPTDYLEIDLTKSTHGTKEIEKYSFIDPSKEHVLPTFLQTTKLEGLADHNEVQFFSYL